MLSSGSERNILLRILIDTIFLIIAGVVVSLFFIDIITPFRRGFFCDDESIKYPYKPSTVTDGVLYIVSCTLGFIVIIISEFFPAEKTHVMEEDVHFCKWNISHRFIKLYTSSYVFMFGVCINDILTNFIKVTLGRLRPNFVDVCQPDFNCSVDPHRFVEDYTCLNTNTAATYDSRLSFPSGHSSVVAYTMLFSMIYLHNRLEVSHSKLVKPVMQVFLFLWAAFTAVSRIGDNKHHATDVVGGAILGISICYGMICCMHPNSSASITLMDPELSAKNVRLNIRKDLDFS